MPIKIYSFLLIVALAATGQLNATGDPLIIISAGLGNVGLSKQIESTESGLGDLRGIKNSSMFGYHLSASLLKRIGKHCHIGPGISLMHHQSKLLYFYQYPESPSEYTYKQFEQAFHTTRLGLDVLLSYHTGKWRLSASIGAYRATAQNTGDNKNYGVWTFNNLENNQVFIEEEYRERNESFDATFIFTEVTYKLSEDFQVGINTGVSGLKFKHGAKLYEYKQSLRYTQDPTQSISMTGNTSLNYYEAKYTLSLNVTYQLSFNRFQRKQPETK